MHFFSALSSCGIAIYQMNEKVKDEKRAFQISQEVIQPLVGWSKLKKLSMVWALILARDPISMYFLYTWSWPLLYIIMRWLNLMTKWTADLSSSIIGGMLVKLSQLQLVNWFQRQLPWHHPCHHLRGTRLFIPKIDPVDNAASMLKDPYSGSKTTM